MLCLVVAIRPTIANESNVCADMIILLSARRDDRIVPLVYVHLRLPSNHILAVTLTVLTEIEQNSLQSFYALTYQMGVTRPQAHVLGFSQAYFICLLRASRGEMPNSRPNALENWLPEAKPVASAISSIDSEVSRSSCLARVNRSAR